MNEPNRIQGGSPLNRPAGAGGVSSNSPARKPAAGSGPTFAQALEAASGGTPAPAQGISFSNHAQKRLERRDIQLTDDSVQRLSQAVDKAEKRGGKSSLVLVDDLAFIVNVRERMVVTAMDTREHGEGVYNQIDSVVFAAPSADQEG